MSNPIAHAPVRAKTDLENVVLPGNPVCLVVHDFLSPAECLALIAQGEAAGFQSAESDYPPSYRNNERLVLDDDGLATALLPRLREYAPDILDDQRPWRLDAINERFRFCRYRPGQSFRIHQDGVHYRGDDAQSKLTFMIYLTDGDSFEGGDTLFHASGPGTSGAERIVARVRPRIGSLILFDHALWHSGAPVTAGVKHIVRSDVIYRRAPATRTERTAFEPRHQGYVWTLERAGTNVIASGGRDCAIRLWTGSGESLGALRGHTRSVLGLARLHADTLASVSRDRSLRFWSVASRRCRTIVENAHDATALCITSVAPDVVATGGADAAVRLWNLDGRLLQVVPVDGWVWALAVLVHGAIVAATEAGSLCIIDVAAGRVTNHLPGDVPLRAVTTDPVSGHIYAGDNEGDIVCWGQHDSAWQEVKRWRAHAAAVRRLRTVGDRLGSAGEDRFVRLWDADAMVATHAFAHSNFATDFLPTPNGGLLSCAYDGGIAQNSRR